MSEFHIFETDNFIKELDKLSSRDGAFLKKKLSTFVYLQLKENPFFGQNIKKLKTYTPTMWRYRAGRYRLFFIIDNETHIVKILALNARKDVYR